LAQARVEAHRKNALAKSTVVFSAPGPAGRRASQYLARS
jgi:hypothetical protein